MTQTTLDINRIELHRNGLALLPAKDDMTPGVAFLLEDRTNKRFQRQCTCDLSKKKTCAHLLALRQAYKEVDRKYGEIRFEVRLKSSMWHFIAAVMADSNPVLPKDVRLQQESAETKQTYSVCYHTESHQELLFYLSLKDDHSRFKQRCTVSHGSGKKMHRSAVLDKLLLLTLSDNEIYMASQGFKTRKHSLEENFWFRWGYHCFREFGAKGCSYKAVVEPDTGQCCLDITTHKNSPVCRIPIPRRKVYELLTGLNKRSKQFSLPLYPAKVKPVFNVSLTADGDLEFRPLLQITPNDSDEPVLIDRKELENFDYGRLLYLKDKKRFVILSADISESSPKDYALKIIKKERVPRFWDTFRPELKNEQYLIDESLSQLKVYKKFDWGRIMVDSAERDWYWLSMEYGFGKSTISLADIYKARRKGQEFIPISEGWIDCQSAGLEDIELLTRSQGGTSPFEGQSQMKLSRLDLLRLRAANENMPQLSGKKQFTEKLQKLFKLKPSKPLPKINGMTSTLRNYQKIGTEWISFLYENGFGGLLCDDMGLGKTHQVMAFMVYLNQYVKEKQTFIVVCPTTVIDHWSSKIQTHAPGLRTAIYHGSSRNLANELENTDVLITTYGILRSDIALIQPRFFTLAVFDEVQFIKNPETLGYNAAFQVQADMKLGLTGTPIENSILELKALIDLTVPGYLGSKRHFQARYLKAVEKGLAKKRRNELRRLVYPFTLRRLKKTVLSELPEKIEDIRFCRLSDVQVKLYQDTISRKGSDLIEQLNQKEQKVPYIHIFALLTLLKQICDHPALLSEQINGYEKIESGKWELFKDILDQCLDSGQKIVVYSQFLGMLEIMGKYLERQNVGYVSLTGKSTHRGDIVARFNDDDDCRVFLGSLKAGGVGIDLVAASVVIHYDRWWNAAKEDQATDRVHRIGQKRGVQVFKLVTKGTLEEKISSIIESKRDLMDSIVKEDDPGLLKSFSREELLDMLTVTGPGSSL